MFGFKGLKFRTRAVLHILCKFFMSICTRAVYTGVVCSFSTKGLWTGSPLLPLSFFLLRREPIGVYKQRQAIPTRDSERSQSLRSLWNVLKVWLFFKQKMTSRNYDLVEELPYTLTTYYESRTIIFCRGLLLLMILAILPPRRIRLSNVGFVHTTAHTLNVHS